MFCGGLGGDEGKLGREVVGTGEETVPHAGTIPWICI